ncbi:TrkA family potassium uptake protein [Salinimicrobium tongyeongense]|jgi:trk system potassium uptake protein TrkA|uniref:TrkA family potassium uptake protein n=1 Tax=Salinimicrobium tongyeongense TaxID=2809707 RepID=A0ABY6NT46_9FLAO|nr:TrkA family potassium uptake protein [Salinimicrobium tongyeongense]UZH56085.1 TrkA family potassium uptake protein [Salinimicrobium tongyeongense]
MKYIIIGLGNFGASLAEKLTKMGNEVIGVDMNMSKVEAIKDKITHAVNLDSTDITAVSSLPLSDTDIVIVGIGEDKGANIMATALMKQLHVKRLISRAVSPLQEMVLEAMGVDEIIHPEEETAERWAKKLNLHGVVDSFEVNRDYSIIETEIPAEFDGRTLEEIGLKRKYDIIVLTTIKITREKNEIGTNRDVSTVQGVASAKTILHKHDIMVLYGNNKNLKKLLKDQERY